MRLADRETVESGCEEALIEPAAGGEDVALLVVGDPFSATTHTDLQLRAREAGVEVEVVHNASVMTAIGCCGLQLYRFGETISIVFFTDTWRPDSFYDKIKANREMVRRRRARPPRTPWGLPRRRRIPCAPAVALAVRAAHNMTS